jgi:hypothetical protein
MKITCRLQGGLGNQLFQIMTTIYFAKYHQCEFFFIHHEKSGGDRPVYWDTLFQKLQPFLLPPGQSFSNIHYYHEPNFEYHPLPPPNREYEVWCLCGYFQSPNYFPRNILSYISMDKQEMKEMISVHFRYGDYEHLKHIYVALSETQYYQRAIAWIRTQTECRNWKLFFEHKYDTEEKRCFRKSLFDSSDNVQEVDVAASDWESLLEMASCRYHILANSTFSWWGAYLSLDKTTKTTKTKGIVVYPLEWFHHDQNKKIQDLIPNDPNWFGI